MPSTFSKFLAEGQSNDLATWIAVSIGGLGLLYLLMRPKGKKLKDPLSSGPAFSLSQQRSVERQMENLLVELSNMARQITAQLDTRAAKLELLLKEADDRLAALKEAMASPVPPPPASPVEESFRLPPQPVMPTVTEPTLNQRYAEVYSLADEGHSSPEIARRVGQPAGEVELILALRPR